MQSKTLFVNALFPSMPSGAAAGRIAEVNYQQ
jgi:hypothetical protein